MIFTLRNTSSTGTKPVANAGKRAAAKNAATKHAVSVPTAKSNRAPAAAGDSLTTVARPIHYARPKSIPPMAIDAAYGKVHSFELSPHADVAAAITDKAVLLVRPSTGTVLAAVPRLISITGSGWAGIEFTPTHVLVRQACSDRQNLCSAHDNTSGHMVPSVDVPPIEGPTLPRHDYVLHRDGPTVWKTSDLPRYASDCWGQVTLDKAKGVKSFTLGADEVEATGFKLIKRSPSGRRLVVTAQFADKHYTVLFAPDGRRIERVAGRFLGFVPGTDHLVVARKTEDTWSLALCDGESGRVMSDMPLPGIESPGVFQAHWEPEHHQAPRPAGSICFDKDGRTLVVCGSGKMLAWRFDPR